jgi:phosphoesterase RecJ-like protein
VLLEQFKLNPGVLSEQVFDLRPLPFYILLKKVLGTLELHGGKKIAALTASREMLEQSGALREDLDGMINFARNIEGVEIGIMFFIDSPGEVKVGFRSRNVDVSALAGALGGGGHIRAAGCRLKEPYARVREKVLREALRALAELEGAKGEGAAGK